MDPVLMIALRAAIAGPTGVSLGWWLGRRGERDRTGREERKSAYAAFLGAAIRYRFATDEERRVIRDERWAGLAEEILVAPPDVVRGLPTGCRQETAPHAGPDRGAASRDLRRAVEEQRRVLRLARADLGIGIANPFEGYQPSVTEEVTFGPPAPAPPSV